MSTESPAADLWPPKHTVLGVQVSATTYDEAVGAILRAAEAREPATVTALAVHGLIVASQDPQMRAAISDFSIVTPDGQPVRAALNLLYGAGLRSRVYGPELMLRLCREAGQRGVSIYLYGSTRSVVERLRDNLIKACPGLKVAGAEPSIFRPLSDDEDAALVERIEQSGAGLVVIGLGCPRQEQFAHEHRDRIRAVQVCVGAAFDFHAGNKKMAPRWMQDRGLEWLFRLCQEPRRLWRRYLVTNSLFLMKLSRQMAVQAIGRFGNSSSTQTEVRI